MAGRKQHGAVLQYLLMKAAYTGGSTLGGIRRYRCAAAIHGLHICEEVGGMKDVPGEPGPTIYP